MKRLFSAWALFLAALLCLPAAWAELPVPAAPAIGAKSFILVDYDSGRILAERDADTPVEPASITKLMTAYVLYDTMRAGKLKDTDSVTISERAWRMQGSKMFVEVGKQVTVNDLLKGMIIQSGNDATVALAEHVAGSEEAFVGYMNAAAKKLGMTRTHFQNSTGWPAQEHYASARDIATLMAALIREFPDQYPRYSEKEYTWNNIRQHNRNRLLWRDASVDGGKTGHTESAGFCLVASAKRENMRLIAVVLGAQNDGARTEQVQSLLNYGFRFFETVPLRKAGEKLAEPRVWKGEAQTVGVGLARDMAVTIPRGQADKIEVALDLPLKIEAPLAAGQDMGRLIASVGGQPVAQAPVVALQAVPEGGFFRRMTDSVILMFK
ncbi:MAG: D-alanyl-D-alanine carboxypeptidase [Halothiobacillaceae bacterium]|nr:D-alanyl-D-alanine carboxypeptidase [Halothiobacillaceae bacterium]